MIPHISPPSVSTESRNALSLLERQSARPWSAVPGGGDELAELALYERRNGSTERFRPLLRFGLGEHAHDGLRAAGPHQNAACGAELAVQALHLVSYGVTQLLPGEPDVPLGLR